MDLTFQASANWVLYFKKRHGINQKVRNGNGGSADHLYVAIAQAGIPILLRNYDVNPCYCYNMDETGLNYHTVKNCWNHAKILPRPVTSGAVDEAIDELKVLLIEFADSSLDIASLVNHVSEQWTEELCVY